VTLFLHHSYYHTPLATLHYLSEWHSNTW